MKLTDDKHCFIPEEDQCGWRWGKGYELNPFLSTMKQIYKRNTALDIGAHVGIWSKRLASEFSDVVSFEPIPQHIECWIRNVKNDNVVLNKVAISDKIGTATMKYINYFTGMSTLHYNAEDMDYEFKRLTKEKILQKPEDVIVETKTIDSYNFHNVDFIKMDVEGQEKTILTSTTEKQWSSTDMMVEIGSEQNSLDIFEHFKQFKMCVLLGLICHI